MKKAIQFGAGNIGRGFLGQLFNRSGYETVFIEVNEKVISAINEKKCYTLKIVGEKNLEFVIDNIRAVNALNVENVAGEIRDAYIMATAVGVNILEKTAPAIAAGIKKRHESGVRQPLNIIICENLLNAGKILKGYIGRYMNESQLKYMETSVGFVEAVVSRMIPVVPDNIREKDPLVVMVEEYGILPVSKKGFVGHIPEITGVIPYDNLEAYEVRKIFIHNLGHSSFAYLGYGSGCSYIWEAVDNPEIKQAVNTILNDSGRALIKKHGFTPEDMKEHVDDLLKRFSNKSLGDTVYRVGREPIRKLGYSDRFIGSARLCMQYGISPKNIINGVLACLKYDYPQDNQALELQEMIKSKGIAYTIESVCKLNPSDELSEMIIKEWERMR